MSNITNGHRRFTGREISEELVKKMKREEKSKPPCLWISFLT